MEGFKGRVVNTGGILHRVFIIQINTIYLYCTGRTWYVTLYHCIHNIIIKIKTLHT